MSIYRFEEQICEVEPNLKTDIKSLLTKHKLYLECLKSSNVFIIPNGELEHFFKATSIDYLNITKKDVLFTAERDEILAIDEKEVLEERYKDILPLLTESVPYIKVDTLKHAKFTIIDWIQNVQNAINRGEIRDIQSLRTNARVNYSTYSQILECKDDGFILNPDNTFSCTIDLKSSVVGEEKQIIFSDKTTPRNFKIE